MLVTLRCAHGTFVVAEGGAGGAVNADRSVARGWETFALCDIAGIPLARPPAHDDLVTLRARTGHPDSRLVFADWGSGRVRANALLPVNAGLRLIRRDGAGTLKSGNRVAFASPSKLARRPPATGWMRRWLTAELDPPRPVVATRERDDPGGWETFELTFAGAEAARVDLLGRHTQTPVHASAFQMTSDQFQKRFDQLSGQGYRLTWLHGSPGAFDTSQFAAIWVRDGRSIDSRVRHGLTPAQLDSRLSSFGAQGFSPVCVCGYTGPVTTLYAAIWWRLPEGELRRERHGLSASAHQAAFDELSAQGFSPTSVMPWAAGGEARYSSTWRSPSRGVSLSRHGLSSSAHQALFGDPSTDGLGPVSVAGARIGANDRFASVWRRSTGAWTARHDVAAGDLQDASLREAAHGRFATSLSGYGPGMTSLYTGVWAEPKVRFLASGPESIDAMFTSACDSAVETFMRDHRIRGLQVAAAVNRKLVLARAYSLDSADEPPVQPQSIARIASISKPITAVAVMRLVQDGELDLEDKLADIVDLRGPVAGTRLQDITIRHLLHHVAGWKFTRDETGTDLIDTVAHLDPMFLDGVISRELGRQLPLSRADIIEYVTTRRSLDFTPGERYSYANYGYCLLGRVIEAKTGQSYATFVQDEVLEPLGITRMRLGRTLFEHRAEGELSYYTRGAGLVWSVRHASNPPLTMNAYGAFNLENMDAHGGWLASAVDLTRFACEFLNPGPLLNRASLDEMFAPPLDAAGNEVPTSNGGRYGCGWTLEPDGSRWHNGALPGTFGLMKSNWPVDLPTGHPMRPRARRAVSYAILINRRNPKDDMPFDPDGLKEFVAERDILPGSGWDLKGLVESLIMNRMPNTGPQPDLFPQLL